jgi:hypothetical protein
MKNRIITVGLGVLLKSTLILNAQPSIVGGGPYTLITSEPFDVTGRQLPQDVLGYGKDGIIQVNSKDAQVISFQKFSAAMKLEKENSIDIQNRITGRVFYERAVAMKNKNLIFLRDVKKDLGVEGITAFEFFPDKLELSETPVSLFQSSRRVSEIDGNMYRFALSKDRSKFLYSYLLRPIDYENRYHGKEVYGIHVFDANIKKLWGGEYEMPYGVRGMRVGDLKLADNGNAYLLIKVFDCMDDCFDPEGNDPVGIYHYEVLIFQKDMTVRQVKIEIKNYELLETILDETPSHEIQVISTYIESAPGDGLVRNIATGIGIGKISGGKYIAPLFFYSIPNDVVKLYADKRTLEEIAADDAAGLKPGIRNLKIRNLYYMPNGSTKIITEVYSVRTYYVQGAPFYDVNGGDLILFSMDANLKLEWVKKIRKYQHTVDQFGNLASINVICKENNLHLFFLDHIPNESETPGDTQLISAGLERYLKGVSVDEKGNTNRYSLGKIWMKSNNFYVRKFTDGGNSNLIGGNMDNKKNKLFSIQLN